MKSNLASIKEWQKRTNYKGIGPPVKKEFNEFEKNWNIYENFINNPTDGFCKSISSPAKIKKTAARYGFHKVIHIIDYLHL